MKIAIVGCGYLGHELAKKLYGKDYFVTCSSNNPESLKNFIKITHKSLVMSPVDVNEMLLLLHDNDVIIVTISTKAKIDYEQTLFQTAQNIKKCARLLNVPKTIIYTSKSSIYGNHEGMWVDEYAELKATDDESKILINTENLIISLKDLGWKVAILRLAQVYGPGKDLIKIYQDIYKQELPGHPEYYTNMVHQQDAVGVICHILEHQLEGIYNVADDDHPTRGEFSEIICGKLNLPKPKFNPKLSDFADNNKRVSNYKIKESGYVFKYPSRWY